MVTKNGVVFQRASHRVSNAVITQVFRYGIQRLNATNELIIVIPLLKLREKRLGVVGGVRNVVHACERLV